MSLIYPKAEQIPWAYSSGGSMIGGPARGTLHSTESYAFRPSKTSYYGHRNPPHMTLDPNTMTFYQHLPFEIAARALRNLKGGVQTNRQGKVNIQIELVWKAANMAAFPDDAMDMLREFMIWASHPSNGNIPFATSAKFLGSEGWGTDGAARLSNAEWLAYNGWLPHAAVPENNHWDVGRMDIDKLFTVPPQVDSTAYTDVAAWPKWATAGIQKAIDSGAMVGGVVNGKKVWNPEGPVTRAQLAVVLDRLKLLER